MTPPRMFTPPEIARQLGIKPGKIIGWIRAGELRGIDISTRPGCGRPRFRIDPADLAIFLNARAVSPAPKPTRRRRQHDPAVTEFF